VAFHVVPVEDPAFGWMDVNPAVVLHTLLVIVAAELGIGKLAGGTLSSSELLGYFIGFGGLLRTPKLQIVGIFDDDGIGLLWWSFSWWRLLRLQPTDCLLFWRCVSRSI